jgi:two-component system, response regulator PdtaR
MRTKPSPFSRPATIFISFTDIHMPGSMDGLKLAHFVRDRWPPVKIVATSGRVRITDSDLPEGGRFLPKPYFAVEITATLRELIRLDRQHWVLVCFDP